MKEGNVIEVTDVYKTFGNFYRNVSLKELITEHKHLKKEKKREVLHGISFDIKRGEAVAIIGRNGSGKSTILKLLTRILNPNGGTVETKGKMSCLIELGAGFHPDMTGRENVYINASIFGMGKEEVDEKFDEILAFSEIGDHIDERVRNYSSGMYMRLAFAIAINVNAELLIVDEILAVGDIAFQRKCLEKIRELKAKGVTIVIVTHSVEMARELCDRVIWIHEGVIRDIGDPNRVCDEYEEFMSGTFDPIK